VGICEVLAEEEIRVLAWSGPSDPRDRPGAAGSEIAVPILGITSAQAVGLLRVDVSTFGEEDRRLLEECAALLRPLWG